MNKLIGFIVLCAFCIAENFAGDCICPTTLEIRPTCGSNGKTYINPGAIECHNKCEKAGVSIVKYEPCQCDCYANRLHHPVCGSDEKSYVNPSAVECHNECNYPPVEIVHEGLCKEGDKAHHE